MGRPTLLSSHPLAGRRVAGYSATRCSIPWIVSRVRPKAAGRQPRETLSTKVEDLNAGRGGRVAAMAVALRLSCDGGSRLFLTGGSHRRREVVDGSLLVVTL